jgi:hypothetical protein
MKLIVVFFFALASQLSALPYPVTNASPLQQSELERVMKKFGDKLPEQGMGAMVDKLQKDKKLRFERSLELYQSVAANYGELCQDPLGLIKRLGEAREGFQIAGTATASTAASVCPADLNIERFTYQSAYMLDAVMNMFMPPKKKALGALLAAYSGGLVIYKNAPCPPKKTVFDDFESGAFQLLAPYFDKAEGATGTAQVIAGAGGHFLQISGTVKGWGLAVEINSGYAQHRRAQASEISLKLRSAAPATVYVRINDSKFIDATGYWQTPVPFELKGSPDLQVIRVKAADLAAKDKPIPMDEALRSASSVVLWIEKAAGDRVVLDVDDIQIR